MARQSTKRKDKDRIVLRKGEWQRPNGSYDYRWTDQFGKRHVIYGKTLEELREKEKEVDRDISDGIKAEKRNTTINELFDLWCHIKRGLKDNTFQNYKYMFNTFVRPKFGKLKISQVKKSDVKRFYNYLADERGLQASTIDSIHTVLHQVFDLAVDDGYIRSNPSERVLKELKQAHCFQTEKRKALTVDEQELLLDYLRNTPRYRHWYPIFAVMLGTGLRVGEATGLRWCDIDLDEGLIDVNHTLVYYSHGPQKGCYFNVNTPKTKAGERVVPMLGFVKEAFLEERENQKETGISCNVSIDGYTDFIFVNRYGDTQHLGTLNKAIRRIIRDCNDAQFEKSEDPEVLLPHFSCHTLRHTFTTRMCEAGVNIVLDFTAVEEIWRRFLGEIGYSHSEIKKLLSGPAYYAWQWLGNQMGQGGPLPDAWFARRTELARKNHRIMRALGMEIVLPGYSGMVPNDIALYDSDVKIVPQGSWGAFSRPPMLHPDHPCFSRYAKHYYDVQKKVFGENRYFTDTLFHEGGNKEGMSERKVARTMLDAMLRANNDAVWVITSWQHNPTSELLAGIAEPRKKHSVVLDLYGEKMPNYKNGKDGNHSHGYSPEFDGTPWILCMLNNFGGRLGLHGHLDYMVKGIPYALNNTNYCAGVGITPEASENNPILYDFLFDCIWQENAAMPLSEINIDEWIKEYAERRYGIKSSVAENVINILCNTVYKGEYNMKGQGAPESVTNARPALKIGAASTWGNTVIDYDKKSLRDALSQLLSLYELAKDSAGYQYDLVALSLQVLANEAQDIHKSMSAAFIASDISAFDSLSDRFLNIIKDMDKAAAASPYFSLDRWTNMAKKLADDTDDFTKRIFLYNARALITTWGSYRPSEIGQLHDYSNRTWSGLLGGLYYERWAKWIAERKKELHGNTFDDIDWFKMEWLWIWS